MDRYLNVETRKQLVSKCEHVLIRQHSELMWESFQNLLDFDKDEDLQRMYALLSRIPEGVEPLRKKFEEHVKKTGLTAISKLVGEGSEGAEGSRSQGIRRCVVGGASQEFGDGDTQLQRGGRIRCQS